MFDASASMLS
ncbi:unnamed protein product, partial [Didymodactylos carnosus]